MLTWTIEHFRKKGRRREVTVNKEGKVTTPACARILELCLDNSTRCDHLVLDLARVEEKDASMPVLFCCIRKTTGFVAKRVALRGIPPWQPGPTTDFSGISQSETCEYHEDCQNSVFRLAYGAPPVGTLDDEAQ